MREVVFEVSLRTHLSVSVPGLEESVTCPFLVEGFRCECSVIKSNFDKEAITCMGGALCRDFPVRYCFDVPFLGPAEFVSGDLSYESVSIVIGEIFSEIRTGDELI